MLKSLTCLLLLSFLYSCNFKSIKGSGKMVTEALPYKGFKKISGESSIKIIITQGNSYEVILEADDNILQYVKTTLTDDALKIGIANNVSTTNAHITLRITAPEITDIAASSSSEISIIGNFNISNTLNISASSSAKVNGTINGNKAIVNASSSSNVKLAGNIKDLIVNADSSGEIDAFNLLSNTVNASASSSASINVYAISSITADASSSGRINYKGNAVATSNTNSSGSIKKQ